MTDMMTPSVVITIAAARVIGDDDAADDGLHRASARVVPYIVLPLPLSLVLIINHIVLIMPPHAKASSNIVPTGKYERLSLLSIDSCWS